MSKRRAALDLQRLGFTDLEAHVYLSLVSGGPASGYRVAERVGKPSANVYKALQSLARKGAAVEENKLHHAVDPPTLIARLEAAFSALCREAATALRTLPHESSDPIAARLNTVEQVMAQARSMIAAATSMILIDAFPKPLELLSRDLKAAAKHVRVVVQAYAPTDLGDHRKGSTVVVGLDGAHVMAKWPGHWLNVLIDGRQSLLAYIDQDFERVHHALHVTSLPLSLLFHNGFSAEMQLRSLLSDLESKEPVKRALSRAEQLRKRIGTTSAIPGVKQVMDEVVAVSPRRLGKGK
ncbi:MAG: hypothetical protein NVS3B20_18720 [Polyangiales bacterium]